MQRHKHFAWTWAVAGVLAAAGLGNGRDAASMSQAGGTPGDGKATLLVGMGPATEGFELKLEEVPLTTEPKQYTIGASRVADGKEEGANAPCFHAAEWSVSAR
ncbi:hypothetical protein NR798_10450 [Archangium gephyra]|uniref:hypothetical protein n=1 Tax=Archangium gephyra TaxID=48 RepID=UPI0035D3DAB8